MSPPDTPVTLDDVAEFHQQLLRMDRAGLKVQLDDSGGVTTNLPARLNEILARLASQAGKSASLEQAIVAAEFLPDRYRLALRTYIGKPSTSALALLRGPIQHDTEGAADLRLAMVLPVILLGLIYLGLFYLLLVTLPRLESIYAQLNSEPSLPVQWLMRVRAAMPFWVPGVPVIVLVLWWVLSSGRFGLPRWLPGRVQSFRYLIASLRARSLADHLENSPNDTTYHTSQWASTPMFAWALAKAADADTTERAGKAREPLPVQRLKIVSQMYASMQAAKAQRFRSFVFLFTCVVFGGGLVLLYCLALFAPLIQLLKDIVG